MNVEWLFAADNLIFIVPLALAALYLLAYAVSGVAFGPDELDAQAEVDADGEVDADADADADAEADADADADADHEADAPHQPPFALLALGWLGVGKAPFSVLLSVLFMTWGVVGLCVSRGLSYMAAVRGIEWFFSIPAAGLASALATRWTGKALARYLPTFETYVNDKAALVGCTGTAMFPINEKFGMAFVRDANGDGHQAPCRVHPGAQPIEKGRRVLLVEYKSEPACYYVILGDVQNRDGSRQGM